MEWGVRTRVEILRKCIPAMRMKARIKISMQTMYPKEKSAGRIEHVRLERAARVQEVALDSAAETVALGDEANHGARAIANAVSVGL